MPARTSISQWIPRYIVVEKTTHAVTNDAIGTHRGYSLRDRQANTKTTTASDVCSDGKTFVFDDTADVIV